MPQYQLKRDFFDGAQFHKRGSIVEIAEGSAPSSAVLLDGKFPPPAVEESKKEEFPEMGVPADVTMGKAKTLSQLAKEAKL